MDRLGFGVTVGYKWSWNSNCQILVINNQAEFLVLSLLSRLCLRWGQLWVVEWLNQGLIRLKKYSALWVHNLDQKKWNYLAILTNVENNLVHLGFVKIVNLNSSKELIWETMLFIQYSSTWFCLDAYNIKINIKVLIVTLGYDSAV